MECERVLTLCRGVLPRERAELAAVALRCDLAGCRSSESAKLMRTCERCCCLWLVDFFNLFLVLIWVLAVVLLSLLVLNCKSVASTKTNRKLREKQNHNSSLRFSTMQRHTEKEVKLFQRKNLHMRRFCQLRASTAVSAFNLNDTSPPMPLHS